MMAGSVLTVLPVLLVFLALPARLRARHPGGEREGVSATRACVRAHSRSRSPACCRERHRQRAGAEPIARRRLRGRRAAWSAAVRRDGVDAGDRVRRRRAPPGSAMRLDFDFPAAAATRSRARTFDLELPENYALHVPASAARRRPNTSSSSSSTRPARTCGGTCGATSQFPRDWQTLTIKKRQIQFAWGPAGGGEIRDVAAIEIAITAGSGGSGHGLDRRPRRSRSCRRPTGAADAAARRRRRCRDMRRRSRSTATPTTRVASSGRRHARPWIALDLGGPREFGGLVHRLGRATTSRAPTRSRCRTTARTWTRRPHGARRERRARLRLPARKPSRAVPCAAISGAASRAGARHRDSRASRSSGRPRAKRFFEAIAREAPPRHLSARHRPASRPTGRSSASTATTARALLSEDGSARDRRGRVLDRAVPAIDERARHLGRRRRSTQSLESGDLPIPTSPGARDGARRSTSRRSPTGEPGGSTASSSRYRVDEPRATARQLRHALPGAAPVPGESAVAVPQHAGRHRADRRAGARRTARVRVNGDRAVVPSHAARPPSAPRRSTTATSSRLPCAATLPPARRGDAIPLRRASGALRVSASTSRPGHRTRCRSRCRSDAAESTAAAARVATHAYADAGRALRERVDASGSTGSTIALATPGEPARRRRSLQRQLGYILVNRDGPAIQPGSRAYARSWIRDGALTSAALLRLGPRRGGARVHRVVRAATSTPNGKVPCCVDRRGADPVPEHDSHGEFIYLVAEYYRYTGDRALRGAMWPHVVRPRPPTSTRCAHERRTDEYRTPGQAPVLRAPAAVDQPRGLLGQADALLLGRLLRAARLRGRRRSSPSGSGDEPSATRFAALRDEFARDLAASIAAAMARARHRLHPGLRRARRLRRHLDDDRARPAEASRRCCRGRARRARSSATGEFVARAARRRADGRRTRPTSCAPSARSCGWAGATARSELLDWLPRPPAARRAGGSGPRSCGRDASARRASSATCRTPGWARTSSARCSTCFAYERESDEHAGSRRRHSARVARLRGRGRDRESADARTVRSPTRCDPQAMAQLRSKSLPVFGYHPGESRSLCLKPYSMRRRSMVAACRITPAGRFSSASSLPSSSAIGHSVAHVRTQ